MHHHWWVSKYICILCVCVCGAAHKMLVQKKDLREAKAVKVDFQACIQKYNGNIIWIKVIKWEGNLHFVPGYSFPVIHI